MKPEDAETAFVPVQLVTLSQAETSQAETNAFSQFRVLMFRIELKLETRPRAARDELGKLLRTINYSI